MFKYSGHRGQYRSAGGNIVSGLNELGEVIELEAQGLLARVLQHEIDHLQGKLIIDYLGLLEKMMLLKPKFWKAKDKHVNL